MKACIDCGGDAGKGWTNPSQYVRCASCDMARALGSPLPGRAVSAPTYQQTYYQRRKLGLPMHSQPKPYTATDDAFILKMNTILTVAEQARRLGRSYQSLKDRRYVLRRRGVLHG